MQGDIFQLETLLRGSRDAAKRRVDHDNQKAASLIHDCEDSHLSQYLFREDAALNSKKLNDIYSHAHYLETIASAFDDYCTDTPPDLTDKSAMTSDDEAQTPDEPSSPVMSHAPSKTLNGKTASSKKIPEKKNGSQTKTVSSQASHVSHIEGPMMSLWPLPIEHMEYEWSERFYE